MNIFFFGVDFKKHETSSWMKANACVWEFARKAGKRHKIELRFAKALFHGILKKKQRILWVDMETMLVEYFVADFAKNLFTLKCTNKHVSCKSISSKSVCNLASSILSENSAPTSFDWLSTSNLSVHNQKHERNAFQQLNDGFLERISFS